MHEELVTTRWALAPGTNIAERGFPWCIGVHRRKDGFARLVAGVSTCRIYQLERRIVTPFVLLVIIQFAFGTQCENMSMSVNVEGKCARLEKDKMTTVHSHCHPP